MPAPGSPNVLVIVLDTVAAGHLSLHGYDRPTSPTLDELAERGIRFDRAQATSSWTLPSHAGMFTGRWPHELSAGWLTPLERLIPRSPSFSARGAMPRPDSSPTCSIAASDSGLERGFTRYHDYIFPGPHRLPAGGLVDRPVEGSQPIAVASSGSLAESRLMPRCDSGAVQGQSQGGLGGQSRVPRLAVAGAGSRSGRSSPS